MNKGSLSFAHDFFDRFQSYMSCDLKHKRNTI